MNNVKLYTYYRSSAAFRVRIALHLKGLAYQSEYIHLLKDGGEQHHASYHNINPMALVPTLTVDDKHLHQSLSIIDYLEESIPTPTLYPSDKYEKAWVKKIALTLSCDIHPLNNLRVIQYLKNKATFNEEQISNWMQHWILEGFNAIEHYLSHDHLTGLYCFKNQPTLADICLIPQVYNAIRCNIQLTDFPLITRIYDHCMAQPSFIQAAPENQGDATQLIKEK